ncbi:unnamed protein product [Trifolium pratense]|uniref:Uncharacterized protein n=1 Tax=Trifolium pratense TaxID=57577 RepID=A0ACB0I9J3_TRIPR|nr:unnamed protein product [Trifolium pratense]
MIRKELVIPTVVLQHYYLRSCLIVVLSGNCWLTNLSDLVLSRTDSLSFGNLDKELTSYPSNITSLCSNSSIHGTWKESIKVDMAVRKSYADLEECTIWWRSRQDADGFD